MRKTLFVVLLTIQILILHSQTTYNPSCYSNASALTVEKITVNSSNTTVNMKFYTESNNYEFWIDQSMYIQEYGNPNSRKYYIKEFVGNELNKKYLNDSKTPYYFTWIFEKTPQWLTNISIIEPPTQEGTPWYWKNIKLNNKSSSSSLYTVKGYTYEGYNYDLYSFLMGGDIKAQYFAKNAYSQYKNWKYGKKELLICSGAFSETWESYSKPVGFTVDNGIMVNKSMDAKMDAFVMVMDNYVSVLDLDNLSSGVLMDDGSILSINPRKKTSDRLIVADAAEKEGWTVFQTQLVYSQDKKSNFGNLYYGKKAERRFLAVCSKDGYYYNVIVDAPDDLYLNLSAKYAKVVLEHAGFGVHYILNLDTGGKNIFLVREGNSLSYKADDKLSKATNLVIFYK